MKVGRKKGCTPWNRGKTGVYSRKTIKQMSKSQTGCPAWNKGLTKETDKRVMKYALSTSISRKGQHNSPRTEFKKNQFSGTKHSNWKGGVFKNYYGYICIFKPKHPHHNKRNYVLEHRLIVEKQISRYLTSKEEVHHLGKKDDNRPHMLIAFINHSTHMRFERGGQYSESEIIFDGRKLKQKGDVK